MLKIIMFIGTVLEFIFLAIILVAVVFGGFHFVTSYPWVAGGVIAFLVMSTWRGL